MNQRVLIAELVKELEKLFAGYELRNKLGVLQQLQIFPQYLPQPAGITFTDKENAGLKNYSANDYESNFPCIIVKLEDMVDNEERSFVRSQVNVRLLIAVYDENKDCQGYLDILDIQEKLRQYLLENRVIASRYVLNMPLKSRIIESETWPVYWGEQELVFTAGHPSMAHDYIHEPPFFSNPT